MTKDQMNWVRKEYPHEVELVMCDLYEWPTSHLVNELIRWMPKSEFMKLVHQMEDDDNE
jgi:hypothetical protein